jgi:ribonuclease T2
MRKLTFTGSGFTLTSSKGPCDIIAGAFSCAAGNTAGVFTVSIIPTPQHFQSFLALEGSDIQQSIDGSFAYGSSNVFYAAAIPVGTVQQKVFIDTNATDTVEVSFLWQSI